MVWLESFESQLFKTFFRPTDDDKILEVKKKLTFGSDPSEDLTLVPLVDIWRASKYRKSDSPGNILRSDFRNEKSSADKTCDALVHIAGCADTSLVPLVDEKFTFLTNLSENLTGRYSIGKDDDKMLEVKKKPTFGSDLSEDLTGRYIAGSFG